MWKAWVWIGFPSYSNQFGFGRVQGIELPLEAAGNVPTKAWKRRTQGEPWSTGMITISALGRGYDGDTAASGADGGGGGERRLPVPSGDHSSYD